MRSVQTFVFYQTRLAVALHNRAYSTVDRETPEKSSPLRTLSFMSTPDVNKRAVLRASETLRQLGWVNGGFFLLHRLLTLVSKGRLRIFKYYLVAQPVAKSRLLPAKRGKNIEVREVSEQDEVASQFPRPLNVIKARFEGGAKCLVAFNDGQFIGFLWLLLRDYREDEVRARYTPLPAGEVAWDFDVYVSPNFRVGPTFLRLWDEANDLLREIGVKWSCSRISAFNTRSVETHARLGARPLGSAVFVCGIRWQITFATIAPYCHLSTHPNSFPDFFLDTEAAEDWGPQPRNKSCTE